MGYTHYWKRKPRLDKHTWNNFVEDVSKLLDQADCPLTYYYKGESRDGYKASSVMVNFNGYGEESHENVYIPRLYKKTDWGKADEDGMYFGFCKTAYKPYDKYVTAVLLLFKHHFGDDVQIMSDGDADDWEEGRLLIDDQIYLGGQIAKEAVPKMLGKDEEEEEDQPKEEAELTTADVKNTDVMAASLVIEVTPEQLKKYKEEYFRD